MQDEQPGDRVRQKDGREAGRLRADETGSMAVKGRE